MPLDNKTQQIYTTLKGGGADVGTEQEFNDYFFAKGDQGYKNRLEVWKALKGGGADVGKNYEEFRDWLGLRATSKPAAPRQSAAPAQPRQAAVAQERRQRQKQAFLNTPTTSARQQTAQTQQPAQPVNPITPTPTFDTRPYYQRMDEDVAIEQGRNAQTSSNPENVHVKAAVGQGKQAEAKKKARDMQRVGIKTPQGEVFDTPEEEARFAGAEANYDAVKDVQAGIYGDAEAAERSGLKAANERMREEQDYYDATGKELRLPVNLPGVAPTAVRDDDGRMLIGMTTDEHRVEQYQQQERERVRRELSKQIIDPVVSDAIEGVEGELDAKSREALVSAMNNRPLFSDDKVMSESERAAYQIATPENLLDVLNRRFGASLDPREENFGGSTGMASDFANRIVAQNRSAIEQGASRLGMSVEDFVAQEFIPQVSQRLAEGFIGHLEDKYSVKDVSDYLTRHMFNSVLGTVASMNDTSKIRRRMAAEQLAKSDSGDGKYYNAGVAAKIGGKVAMFAADAPILIATGAFGGAAARAVGGGITRLGEALGKEGMTAFGRLAASGSPFLAANVGKATKWGGLAMNRALGGTGLGMFMGTSSAIQDLSTGDGSLSSVGSAFLHGFGEGTATGALLGVTNLGAQTAAGNIAGNSMKARLGRAGLFGSAFVAENQLFANMDRFREGDFDWVDSTLDAFYMQLAGKVSSSHGLSESMKGVARLFSGKAYTDKGKTGLSWQSDGFRLSDEERGEIERAFGGTKLTDVAANPENVMKILSDKQAISWKTRQKVAGSMGMLEPSRPRTERILVMDKVIDERGDDYELIESHPFNTEEEKQEILQRIRERRDYEDMLSDLAVLKSVRTGVSEESIQSAAADLLRENPTLRPEDVEEGGSSYDVVLDRARELDGSMASNVVRRFASDYNMTEKEVLDLINKTPDEYEGDEADLAAELRTRLRDTNNTAEAVIMEAANDFGMRFSDVVDIMKKNPVERTEEEYAMMDNLARRLHEAAFPDDVLHESQSRLDGRKEAGEGGEIAPENAQALAEKVKRAEDRLNAFLSSDKQGIGEDVRSMMNEQRRADEILMHISENYSGTEAEQAMKLVSEYYNAKALREGFIEKVGENIDQAVQDEVTKMGFKGTIDDTPDTDNIITISHDGEEYILLNGALGTRESDGTRLIDPGKSGGMIIALDNDGQFVQFKPDARMQITGLESKEDYSNRRREELGVKNTQTLVETGVVPPEKKPAGKPADTVAGGKEKGGWRYKANADAISSATAQDYGKTRSINEDFYSEHPERVQEELTKDVEATARYMNGETSDREYLIELGYATGEKSWLDHATPEEIHKTAEDNKSKFSAYITDSEAAQEPTAEGPAVPQQETKEEAQQPEEEQPTVEPAPEAGGIPLSKNGRTKLYHMVEPDVAIDDILQQPTSKFVKGNNDPNVVADRRIKSAEERLKGLDKKLKKRFEEQDFTNEEAEDLLALERGEAPKTEMGKYVQAMTEAQAEIDYYKKLKGVWQQRKITEAEEARRKADEAAVTETIPVEEDAKRDERFKANREKFEQSKEDGDEDTIVLANGETIEGHYVLVEADAVTPSHNPRGNFAKSEGFPVDENGKTINDRDYENDKTAQNLVQKRSQAYDQRAVNTPVVVSEDGIVLSGNDRTMSGQLAADQGTDKAYVDYITKHAKKWGFTPEQVSGKKNPRIVFVPKDRMEYNAETFAKFNQDEKKSQNSLETAVKMGKVLASKPETLRRIGAIIDQVENLSDLYSNNELTKELILAMKEGGLITDEHIERLMSNGLLSAQGKDEFETMLAGVVVDEDALRILNNPENGLGDLRRSIAYAAVPLVKNQTLGEYSIIRDLSEAVRLYHGAKGSKTIGKDGDITDYFINRDAFDGAPMDTHSLAQLMLANQMAKGGYHLKRVIEAYNKQAQDAAAGQIDMWAGGIRSKEDILTDILKQQGYDAESIRQRVERLREAQPPVGSNTGSGTGGEGKGDETKGKGGAEPGGEPEQVDEKQGSASTLATPESNKGGRAVTSEPVFDGKDNKKTSTPQEKTGKTSEKDEYLKPRNDKEKEIISDVEKKLAEDIAEQQKKVNKAKKKWDDETAKVNQRPEAGLFGDEVEERPKKAGDQLEMFEGEEKPALDVSEENLRKQVKEYEDAYRHEQQELERLKSKAEHDSRVRGALDNERLQTEIDTEGKPSDTVAPAGTGHQPTEEPAKQHFVDNVDKAPKAIKWSEKTTDKGYTYKHVQLGVDGNDLYIRQSGTYANNPRGKEIIYKIKDYKSHSINDVLLDIIDQTDGAPPRHVEDALRKFYHDNNIKPDSILRPAFTDPMAKIEETATEFKKEKDKEIGITHDETPEQKADRERAEKLADTPLTEDEVNGSSVSDVQKTLAKAYIKGNHGIAQTAAYLNVYNDVRNRRQDHEADSLNAGSGAQLAGPADNGEQRPGRTGASTVGVDAGADVPAQGGDRPESGRVPSVEDSKNDVAGSDGKRGDNSVSESEPELDGLSSGSEQRPGGSVSGSRGDHVRRPGGAGQGDGLAEQSGLRGKSGKGKPAAGSDAAISASKQRLAELRKKFKDAGRNGTTSISLAGMNSEQIEVLGEIITESANLGYQYLNKGLRTFNEWRKQMLSDFKDWLQEDFKWSDSEVDEYLQEVWNCEYDIDGVTRTIGEWASFIGEKELKKIVKADRNVKFEAQKAAEGIEVKTGDIDNIRETLPYLLPEQQDDVLKAETQFFDEKHQDREHGNGKGYMFTNGTGTGKTYTGLGIVKRFVKQGKGRVLIITPSQEKVTDWANDGLNLGLEIEKLDDVAKATGTTATKSKGKGVVVTTYANARQNLALLEDCFDLIVYDESHKITEGKEAAEGEMYKFHQMLTNKDVERSMDRQTYWLPEWIEQRNLLKEADVARERLNELEGTDTDEAIEERNRLNARMVEIANRLDELRPVMQEIRESKREQAEKDSKRTKTVFLSATPFNSRENLKYAEGYIFSYPEEDPNTKGSYNHRSPEDAFLEQTFPGGYRWRYGRLEEHISNGEALGRQEIDFSDYLQNQLGTMSGRMITSDYDYSRDFPVLTLDNAGRFNQAMSEVYRNKKYQPLADIMRKVWNYNDATSLFEAMKTSLVNERIKEHLARGQKVVVFHRRRTSRDIAYPFTRAMEAAREMAAMEQDKKTKEKLLQAAKDFEKDFQDIFAWEKTIDYTLPREQIEKRFGKDKVAFFSGAETKNAKHKSVDEFMKDNGGKDIIVIQEASGKEGISLHDQTGEHQRVEINLALPQSPIAFIQIEGRIYRIGQKSNAIFEYPLLGLDLETNLFAQKFNNALGTTENLALGSNARNLKKSIATSVLENTGEVDYDRQGYGGKDMDGRVSGSGGKDGFDVAIDDYYGNQKMSRGRDNREGTDYFPTPEPIGYKMVEWAQMLDGETALEPSAGHGAIARYVPETNGMTAIEPSASLFTKLQMRAGGPGRKFEEMNFEDYPISNKHDAILMNPPYGAGGKTAMEHVAKAFRHLNEGGRIIAIIPDGPSMEKRFDAWLGSDDLKGAAVVTGEIRLPGVAFSRAGTSVNTRIVVIDKVSRAEMRKGMSSKVSVDLRNASTVDELFDQIRNVRMPERTIDNVAINTKKALRTKGQIEDNPFTRSYEIQGNYLRIKSRARYGDCDVSIDLSNPQREDILSRYRNIKNVMDDPGKLDYGRWDGRVFGKGKNAIPAIDAIRDYCEKVIKTLENVSGMTADQMDRALREADEARQRRQQEEQERMERLRQERIEKGRIAIENLRKEFEGSADLGYLTSLMTKAHGGSFGSLEAKGILRKRGVDWETGKKISTPKTVLRDSYREEMPLDLDVMERLMDIAETSIDGRRRDAAKRALEMSGIHSDTGEEKTNFDYSSHDKYYEKELRDFLNTAGGSFSHMETKQQRLEREAAEKAPAKAEATVAGYEYKLDKNTRTGADMHLVTMNNRLSDADYRAVERKAKANGGYYNRFKKAWHFTTEEDARKFMESVKDMPTQEEKPTTRLRRRKADEDGRFEFEKPIRIKEKGISKDLEDIKANKWNLPEKIRDVVAEKLEKYMSDKDGEVQDIDVKSYFGENGETTAKDALEYISNNSTDKGIKKLASYLLKNIGDNGDVSVKFSEERWGARGKYHSNDHSVSIRRAAARGMDEASAKNNLEQTVIHEIAHAITSRAIENSPEVRKEFLQIYKDYEALREQYGIDTGYATKNPKEFVAEFLGRKAFREALMELPSNENGKTFGQKVLDFIKKHILRIKETDTFFKQADDAIKKVMDMANKGDYPYGDEVEEDATTRFRFAKDKEEFDKIREEAVRAKGLVVQGLNDADISITHVDNHEFGDKPIDKARDWANKNLVTSEEDIKNDKLPKMKDGTPYVISKKAIGKYLSEDGMASSENKNVHLSVLKRLKDVISESIEAEVHPDYPKIEGVRTTEKYNDNALIHRLYGAVEIDGKVYRVKTTMQEFRGSEANKPHSYEVTKIELLDSPMTASESPSVNVGRRDADTKESTNNSISGAKLLKDVEKSYDPGKKLLDESEKSTFFRKGGEAQNPVEADFERKRKAGEKIAKNLNMDFEAVTDKSQITNREVLDAIAAGEEPTGWIELDKDGKKKIYMYLPNIRDTYEAEKTIAHETVGHYGLRELLGEKGYKSYMRSLMFELRTPELSKYIEENLSKNNYDMYRTVDEFLADAAEKGYGDLPMWQKVRNFFTDALRKAGFDMTPSISDVKYMVWLSKHHLERRGDVKSKLQRESILWRLGQERYEAAVRNGEYVNESVRGSEPVHTNIPHFPGDAVRFRHTPSVKNQKLNYERALKRLGYVWKEAHVDQMQAAVELMRAISGVKKIEDIPAAENFVLLENQISSKEEQLDFLLNRDYMRPLDDAVAKCLPEMGADIDEQLRNLQLYMIKKHGLERNRVLFVRDAIRELRNDSTADQKQVDDMEQDYIDTIRAARDDLKKGYITLREYHEEIDEWIRQNIDPKYKAGEKDYSGLTAMSGGKLDDSKFIDDVMGIEDMLGEERVNELWEKTKALSQFGLDMEYEGGLDSKAQHDRVSEMFEWYVPLRGYDEKVAEEVYDYLEEDGGNNRRWAGPVLMNAKGHDKYLSDVDVFATLGAMSSYAISRALRNQMKQSFARFVRNHYHGTDGLAPSERLVTELPYLWAEKQYDPKTGREIWVETFPDIPEGAKADDVASIVAQYEADMKAKEQAGDAKRVRQNSSIPYRAAKREHKSQHIVDVWINGEKHSFVVNGNPRAAQAINGQLKSEGAKNPFSRFVRTMAQLNTSYSPDFIVGNTERDFIFASSAVGIKEGARYLGRWWKNYFTSVLGREAAGVPGLHTNLFNRYRNGTLNMNNETDRYFKEFMENGGETGWVETKNLDKWKKEIRKGVKVQGTPEKVGRFVLNSIPKAIEAANERAENMARFATYLTSRQSGRSIVRSVSDAKEVSVNFNRKGAGKKTAHMNDGRSALQRMNAILAARTAQFGQDYYMFYNAGVQGLNNAMKLTRDHPWKASTVFAGFLAGGLLIPWLNQSLIADEDPKERDGIENPYAELPEWVRRNRLCIYKGKGEFITIDLPIELRALYGIGDMAAGHTQFPDLKSYKPVWQDVMTQMTQILPIDFMGEHPDQPLLNFVPSTVTPLAEAVMNTNWYGRKIEKDKFIDEDDPRWKRAFQGTNKAYMGLSKWLNAMTNDSSEEEIRKVGVPEENIKAADEGNKGVADGWVTDPALLEHIVNGYLGGVGQTAGRLGHIFSMIGDAPIGEILGSDKMPVVRRLHYSPTDQNRLARTRNRWGHYMDELDAFETKMKNYKEQGAVDPWQKFKQISLEDSIRATRAEQMKDSLKMYNKLNKIQKNAANDSIRAAAKARIEQLMENTVRGLDAIGG